MNRSQSSTLQDVAFSSSSSPRLALGGALAHALELPNKIGMSREHYFIVQRAYDGWNRLAYLLAVQLFGILAVIWLYRPSPGSGGLLSQRWPRWSLHKQSSGSGRSQPTRPPTIGHRSPRIGKSFGSTGSIHIWREAPFNSWP